MGFNSAFKRVNDIKSGCDVKTGLIWFGKGPVLTWCEPLIIGRVP